MLIRELDVIVRPGMSQEYKPETGRGPWGLLATVVVTVLVAALFSVVQIVVAIPYLILKVAQSPNTGIQAAARALQTDGLFFSLAELLSGATALGFTILIIWLRRGPRLREYLALQSVERLTMLRWLLHTVLLGVLLDGLSYVAGYASVPNWMVDIYRSASFLPLFLFSILVVAPVLEEVVFRGFLFAGLRRSRLGNVGAILVASLVWASVHVQYEWFYVGQVFALGLLLGAARLRTGSLIPPILMHALFSGVATLQAALQSSW
jgi:membrane protease YdiL (CAAX protease family)